MTQGLLAILDSRSFGSVWYWLLLTLAWTCAGRRILGVPSDIISNARRAPKSQGDDAAALLLLDWLSLTVPRWRLAGHEGAALLGVAAFFLSALFLLGFLYDLEMAQALVLLLLPFVILFACELRLAAHIAPIIARAQSGETPVEMAAKGAAHALARHRMVINLVAVITVAVTAYRAAVWFVSHPFGF